MAMNLSSGGRGGRGRRRSGRRAPMAEINVTPLVDVMLVLLIIFMVTAPLLTQGIEVDLPEAAAEPMDQDSAEPIVLSVDVNGAMYLNVGDNEKEPREPGQIVALASAVLRQKPDTAVLVKADKDVAYGRVVTAMVLLQRAGAAKVGFVTDPSEFDPLADE
jgi:biopolymer transport protein TolR